jgi:hypothetical protein
MAFDLDSLGRIVLSACRNRFVRFPLASSEAGDADGPLVVCSFFTEVEDLSLDFVRELCLTFSVFLGINGFPLFIGCFGGNAVPDGYLECWLLRLDWGYYRESNVFRLQSSDFIS